MATMWHHSRQNVNDGPVGTSELRRLAALGRINPQDMVLRAGTDRWVPANKIEGLFNAGHAEWYFTHSGRTFGPITINQLWEAARGGHLVADDFVVKTGMRHWKSARKVVGLFPEVDESHLGVAPVPEPEPRMPAGYPSSLARVLTRPGEANAPHPVSSSWLPTAFDLSRRIPVMLFAMVLLAVAAAGMVWSVSAARQPAAGTQNPAAAVATAGAPSSGEPSPAIEPKAPRRTLLARWDLPLVTSAAAMNPGVETDRTGRRGPAANRIGEPPTPLSVEAERRLGQAMHNKLRREHPVLESDALRERLDRVCRPLLAACRRTEVDYSVTVLDMPEVFAFSHLGGYVYVSRGVLELAESEAELQYVIAHELAHLELKHGASAASRVAGQGRLHERNDAALAPQLLAAGAEHYDDEEELAADAWALETLTAVGLSADQCLALPSHYAAYLRRHCPDAPAQAGDPVDASGPLLYDRHWIRIASTIERLEQLPSLVARVFSVPVPTTRSTPPR